MDSKNYTEVLIDGNIYTLGGLEEESYLQKVASYINDKIALLRKQSGFSRQSAEYQTVMAYLNLADDYFKERDRSQQLEKQQSEMESETYSLKHELVTTQMKLEGALRELEKAQRDMELLKAAHPTPQSITMPDPAIHPSLSEASATIAPPSSEAPATDAEESSHVSLQAENQQLKEELDRLKAVQAAKASIPARRTKSRAKASAAPAPAESPQ